MFSEIKYYFRHCMGKRFHYYFFKLFKHGFTRKIRIVRYQEGKSNLQVGEWNQERLLVAHSQMHKSCNVEFSLPWTHYALHETQMKRSKGVNNLFQAVVFDILIFFNLYSVE